jgi:hypothetical protein
MLNRKNTISCKTIAAKKANSAADASALEGEIDRLVYQLYGLTKEEMALVKGGSKTRSQMASAISFKKEKPLKLFSSGPLAPTV